MKRRNFVKNILLSIATAPVVVDSIFKAVEASENWYEKSVNWYIGADVAKYPATPDESFYLYHYYNDKTGEKTPIYFKKLPMLDDPNYYNESIEKLRKSILNDKPEIKGKLINVKFI